MKKLLPLILIPLLIACDSQNGSDSIQLPDRLSARRIQFVLKLRSAVAEQVWPDFHKKPYEGTLVYFHGDSSEVFFPGEQVRSKINQWDQKTPDFAVMARLDDIPFHMETMISFDPNDQDQIYFENPVEQCISPEEIRKYIPSVQTTEMWASMVLHEMFHHYQYNQPEFFAYAKEIDQIPFDVRNLRDLMSEDMQFRDAVVSENNLLLSAIDSEDEEARRLLLTEFLRLHKQRRATYAKLFPHLTQVEDFYMKQEGSARYAEYYSALAMEEWVKNGDPGIEGDSLFGGYKEFQTIDLAAPDFNYMITVTSTDYHYTLGFNLMRVMDLMGISYREELLTDSSKTFSSFLEKGLN